MALLLGAAARRPPARGRWAGLGGVRAGAGGRCGLGLKTQGAKRPQSLSPQRPSQSFAGRQKLSSIYRAPDHQRPPAPSPAPALVTGDGGPHCAASLQSHP